jgi:peptidoglycan-N-acetylglucosamine deacetylase
MEFGKSGKPIRGGELMLLINTFDVEPWWTTVPPAFPLSHWPHLEDRSAPGLYNYLDLCDEMNVKCTFFFVGWYARRYKNRVVDVLRRGHEVGCHSLNHEDVSLFSVDEFRKVTLEAKSIIEDAGGTEVVFYRAPSFSMPKDRYGEFFSVLRELGFLVDSSISTARRIHGGGFERRQFREPGSVEKHCGVDLFEIPVPGVRILGVEPQIFGGGYLRATPITVLRRFAKSEAYQVLYLHPHDFDRDVPRLPNAGFLGDFRRRFSIGNIGGKLRELLGCNVVRSCGQIYADYAAVQSPS